MKTVVLLLLLCFCAGLAVLPAQSTAQEMENLLNQDAVTYGQAARFILEAAGVTGATDAARAFQYAADQKWVGKNVSSNDTAKLDRIAFLIVRSFNIDGCGH